MAIRTTAMMTQGDRLEVEGYDLMASAQTIEGMMYGVDEILLLSNNSSHFILAGRSIGDFMATFIESVDYHKATEEEINVHYKYALCKMVELALRR